MGIAEHIENNLEEILDAWDEVASRQRPASTGMTERELRDFAEWVLLSIVEEMRSSRSEQERHDGSRGERAADSPEYIADSAEAHAAERLGHGFTISQLGVEYRALRADIIRSWRARIPSGDVDEIEELARFNEAVDESMTTAIGWYHARVEDARELLNGILAHDLRTPVGAIITSSELLLLEDALTPKQTQAALKIRNSASRVRQMIADLLDFTRTRLGTGLPMAYERCDMAKVVRHVCEEGKAFHPDATINCENRGNLVGHWDRSRLEQMLSNLIANAVQHGGSSPVTVTSEGTEEEIAVKVHNEGAPIPEPVQRVIFDPLRRAVFRDGDQSPANAGVGLGLYIARQVAEAHDGTIEVASSQEEGTTFTVRLPRRPKKGSATAGLT